MQKLDYSTFFQTSHLIDQLAINTGTIVLNSDAKLRPIHLDALDVARAVIDADRRVHRPAYSTAPRIIELTLPVRELSRWQETDVNALLHQTLNFGTQDEWHFRFVKRKAPEVNPELTPLLRHAPKGQEVFKAGLFSGGLDSVAGVALQAAASPHRRLLISATGGSLSKMQDDTYTELNRRFSESGEKRFLGAAFRTRPKPAAAKILDDHLKTEGSVASLRSRGFLFLTMGAVTVTSMGDHQLEVYENGVGAINLPFNSSSIGADHSRSMHPLHLAQVQRLYQKLFDPEFQIVSPYLLTTKGRMLVELDKAGFGDLALHTVSCEYFGTRAHGTKLRNEGASQTEPASLEHCGLCTSCLLRRASALYAGILDRDYCDTPALGSLGKAAADMRWYTLMRLQVEHLGTALKGNPAQTVPQLFRAYPDLVLAVEGLRVLFPDRSAAELRLQLAHMYAQYVREFNAFAQSLSTQTVRA